VEIAGPATAAQLNHPSGVAVDPAGSVYVADLRNHRIRKFAPGGIITTVAGTGVEGDGGDGGPATSAQITSPRDVALGSEGSIYLSCESDRIRKVNAQGIINTFAQEVGARGLVVDGSGTVYSGSGAYVRKISSAGVVTTIAGCGFSGYAGDGGPALYAGLSGAFGVVMDSRGRLQVADGGNHRIRSVEKSTLPLPPLAPLILPSSARFTGGEEGATWDTLLHITNFAPTETTLFLKFLGHDQERR